MGTSDLRNEGSAMPEAIRWRLRAFGGLFRVARALPRRALAFLLFLGVFVATDRASAAAPMCGEDAVSIEAPPPLYPSDGATLDACDESGATVELGMPLPEGPLKLKAHVDGDFAFLEVAGFVPKATSVAAPLPPRERPLLTVVRGRQERPPRTGRVLRDASCSGR